MEPLIDVYVDEQFVFLAMKLRPDKGAQDVEPVKITYPSERPMIPLRLTAVAANPDMAVMVWIYADQQAKAANYATMNIENDELTFFGRRQSSNYRRLMGEKADEFSGRAFITEFAAPTSELTVTHPLLQQLSRRFTYVTRLNTVISPEEMTVDPVFDYDSQLKDVSNIRDLSGMTGLYQCERDERAKPALGTASIARRLRIRSERRGRGSGSRWQRPLGRHAGSGSRCRKRRGATARWRGVSRRSDGSAEEGLRQSHGNRLATIRRQPPPR